DLGRPQLQWMTHLVKPQVKAYPVPVTFLGANAVVMCTHQGVKLLLHARLGWLAVHVIPFTGLLYSSNGSQKISVKRIQPKAPALSQGLVLQRGLFPRRLQISGVISNAAVMR